MRNCTNCGNAIFDEVWGGYKCHVHTRSCTASEVENGCSYWSEKKTVKEEKPSSGGTGTTAGKNGVTFTPYVSEDGVISWTNDGNMKNPKPVNIKGPKGDKGDPGEMPDISSSVNDGVLNVEVPSSRK